MHQEQRERTQELLKSKGIERALFANRNSVKWLTGFAPPVQVGPNIFIGAPPVVWYEDGHFTLLVTDGSAAAFGEEADGTVVAYKGYSFEEPITTANNLANALGRIVANSKRQPGQVGVEAHDLPLALANVLEESLAPAGSLAAIDDWLVPLRMVKTDEELAVLRENFELTDLGHATARQVVTAGKREIEVWTAIHSAIEEAAGQRVAMGNDCTVGHRENNMGGWPLDYEIEPQDSIIIDLGTNLHGYWSDSCATYYAGQPTPEQAARHRIIAEVLELGISLIKPGAVAREIDQQVRHFIKKAGYPVYPHHTGHGVGITSHEEPRITPYNNEKLQKGMVIMLEPATYVAGKSGVRLEDAVLVTADGAEVLTHHDKSLP